MNSETFISEQGDISRRALLGAFMAGAGTLVLTACLGDSQPSAGGNKIDQVSTPAKQLTTPETALDNVVWEQDFSTLTDGPVDQKYWNFDLDPAVPGYNNEAEVYTDNLENVRIEGGKLIIEAHKTPTGYSSARINTKGKLTVEQGSLVEVTARLPKGAGAWPAVWMLSDNEPFTVNTTESERVSDPNLYAKNGEIDFLEAMGSDPAHVYPAVHSYESVKAGKGSIVDTEVSVPDATDAEHTYGVLWLPGKLQFLLDGIVQNTVEQQGDTPEAWPFRPENKMYLIANLAMGGTMGGKIDDSLDTWQLAISKIRISKAS